jgi:ribosomal protein S18 acetylase RimI-like enzyme
MLIKNYVPNTYLVFVILTIIHVNSSYCQTSQQSKKSYSFITEKICKKTTQALSIVDFDSNKYSDFIKKQFAENFDLLIGPSAQHSFSVDYMLEHRRCLPESELVTIKVALVDTTPIGFTIYNYGQYNNTMLIPNQEQGSIDIVCIDKNFRNKGYASQLLSYTLNALTSEGRITRIIIGVHTDNIPAISLYKKFGFTFARSHDLYDDIYQLTIKNKTF